MPRADSLLECKKFQADGNKRYNEHCGIEAGKSLSELSKYAPAYYSSISEHPASLGTKVNGSQRLSASS